ncbi:hypothetical protein [Nocardioides sp. 503]|uniref:hypothetical protein n=1 Tax=Nocardioides sp. 503 TaxID=2508326 RepID=UPI00106F1B0A|nr:hypothetical protein [Nocardioides sp. 503]
MSWHSSRTIPLLLTAAGLWSVGLTAALRGILGDGAYLVGGLLLGATTLVAVLASLPPRPWWVAAAFVVVGLLGLVNLLGMLTIGILMLPATVALATAVVLMRERLTPASPAAGARADSM